MASDATAEQVHQISTPISTETRTRRRQGGDELEKSYQRLSHTNANSLLQTALYFASLKQARYRSRNWLSDLEKNAQNPIICEFVLARQSNSTVTLFKTTSALETIKRYAEQWRIS